MTKINQNDEEYLLDFNEEFDMVEDKKRNIEYCNNLERVIKSMLTPLKNVPFNLVIESLCNNKVIRFNKRNAKDIELLETLIESIKKSCEDINKNGILKKRVNEVGNAIEPFLKNALVHSGFSASIPKTSSGKHKSTGYPDLIIKDKYNRYSYIECKTYNINNIDTTQRTFYLSPSTDFKINHNATHFIVSYEIYVEKNINAGNIYKTKSWKIIDAYYLLCDVKYEFNSDNKRMNDKKLLLAEGTVAK